MKTLIIFLFVLLFPCFTYAQPTVAWANIISCGNKGEMGGIVIDSHHNTIVTGYYKDSVGFGTSGLKGSNSFDLFVAKYDSLGNFLWGKSILNVTNNFNNQLAKVAIDKDNNIYLSSCFNSPTVHFTTTDSIVNSQYYYFGAFGPYPTSSFLARYDPSGNFIWATPILASSRDTVMNSGVYVTALAVDSSYDIIIAGSHLDTASILGHLLTDASGLFIAKFQPSGLLKWVKGGKAKYYPIFQGTGITGISIDKQNNILAAGNIGSDIVFDTDTIHSTYSGYYGGSALLMKLDPLGNFNWGIAPKYPSAPGGYILQQYFNPTADANGNVYVSGIAYDTASPGMLAYLAKYSSAGVKKWEKHFDSVYSGISFGNVPYNIIDAQGYPIVLAAYDSAMNIYGFHLPAPKYRMGMFVAKFDSSNGDVKWVVPYTGVYGGTENGYANCIAADPTDGSIVIGGGIYDSLHIKSTILTKPYFANYFVVKLFATTYLPEITNSKNETVVYPNPATSILYINFPDGLYHSVTVINNEGKELLRAKTNNNNLQLNVNSLAPGDYYLRVQGHDNIVETKKFIKR